MTEGTDLLAEARRAADPAAADRLALQAIAVAPDRAAAYALRGELAARRGDAVAAAHHFRTAYARGDRSAETRAGLAACLAVAGQEELAVRVREGLASAPPALAELEDLAIAQAAGIRLVLGSPLPPRGQAALLPGERLPAVESPEARSEPSAPPPEPPPLPESRPPEPRPAEAPEAARGPSRPPGPAGAPGPRTRRLAVPPPEWLETTEASLLPAEPTPQPDWLVSAGDIINDVGDQREGPVLQAEKLDLVVDPGVPEVAIRSPITGRMITPDEMAKAREEGHMPELVVEDPLEAEGLFRETLPPGESVSIAVHLPGPVMTAPGMPPRTLARRVALGVTAGEVLLRDPDRGPEATVRLPVGTIRRLDVVGDGQQLSLVLADGRQVHLDLRQIRRRTPRTAHLVIDALTSCLETSD
jgi:hypothetical protein